MLQMLQSGLQEYWRKRNQPTTSAKNFCKDGRPSIEKRALTLQDLQSAFLILAVGLALAIIVFFLEILCYNTTTNVV